MHSRQSLKGKTCLAPPVVKALSLLRYGRLAPQLPQNAPSFICPHWHVQVAGAAWGFGFPQLPQNLPVFCAPHSHTHASVEAGLGVPQFAQNLPVFEAPHEHVHASPAGAGAGAAPAATPIVAPGACASGWANPPPGAVAYWFCG